jgi:hypothetical protein
MSNKNLKICKHIHCFTGLIHNNLIPCEICLKLCYVIIANDLHKKKYHQISSIIYKKITSSRWYELNRLNITNNVRKNRFSILPPEQSGMTNNDLIILTAVIFDKTIITEFIDIDKRNVIEIKPPDENDIKLLSKIVNCQKMFL